MATVQNILKKKYRFLKWDSEWIEAFGSQVEDSGVFYISGKSSNGKSSFTNKLTKEFARIGKRVLYLSLEMKTNASFQSSIKRDNWMDVAKNGKIRVEEDWGLLDLREHLDKSYTSVVIVDSEQELEGLTKSSLKKLRRDYPKKLFVFIGHVKSSGDPNSKLGEYIQQQADLKIWVEGFRAISKGRSFGEIGYYNIWKERADQYWQNKNENASK